MNWSNQLRKEKGQIYSRFKLCTAASGKPTKPCVRPLLRLLLSFSLILLLSSLGGFACAASRSTKGFLRNGTINNQYWGIVLNKSSAAAQNVTALNAAFTAASKQGIKEVRLIKGTYYVDGSHSRVYSVSDKSISIPSDLAINLNGSTLIQIPNNKEGYAIFTLVGSKNVSISNGILVGDRTKHTYSGRNKTHEYGFGIDVRGSVDVTLQKLEIYDMTGDSILVGGKDTYLKDGGSISRNIVISNGSFHDNRRQGISIIGASDVEISGCKIYNIGMEKGTDPSCGIDLENELDWPIEGVVISRNTFYNNKKASIMVHRGCADTFLENNTITGYIALVYGQKTTIRRNTIKNGGIYSVDTSEPIYSVIEENKLYSSNIEILKNFATVIRGNTISNGVIKFNYASGAIYQNMISNTKRQSYAIQVYVDKQARGYTFTVYLSENKISGKYSNQYSVSKYHDLTVINDAAKTIKYIDSYNKVVVASATASDQQTMELQSSTPQMGLGIALLAALAGLGALVGVKKRRNE